MPKTTRRSGATDAGFAAALAASRRALRLARCFGTNDANRSVTVTFKAKEKTPDEDKLEAAFRSITSTVKVFTADDLGRGVTVPAAMPPEMIGYGVNRYEAPASHSRASP